MSEFTRPLPEWNAEGVEPSQTRKDDGWQQGIKPAADYHNWWMYTSFRAFEEIRQVIDDFVAEKGQSDGLATLDSTGNVPSNQLENVDGMENHGNEFHTEEFETTAGAQSKADTAESNANSYTDNQVSSHSSETMLDSDETVKVGSGGDFATINEALEYLSKKHHEYKRNGISAEINLLSGFEMREGVHVKDIDLSWITISSEDAEVTIIGEDVPSPAITNVYDAVFCAYNASLPVIKTLFSMDGSGNSNLKGIYVTLGSYVLIREDSGIKNAKNVGIDGRLGSTIIAHYSIFDGAGSTGLYLNSGCVALATNFSATNCGNDGVEVADSSLGLYNSDLHGAGGRGLYARSASRVNAGRVDASSCSGSGFYVAESSIVDANYSTATNSDDFGVQAREAATISFIQGDATGSGHSSGDDIAVYNGGIIAARSADGSLFLTPNEVTSNGIIFD